MVKKIVFSPEANRRLEEIITYLLNEWSINSADKFIELLENKLTHIKRFPFMSPSLSDKPDIHFNVINNKITLYCKIFEQEIEVITLFDSRQNPSKLKV